MATKDTISECMTILRLMKGEAWEDDHALLYARVISPWEDEFAKKVVERADETLTWRPSRAELRTLAASMASPIPDDDECYAEIAHKLEMVGPYGRQDPNCPGVYREGAPAMSHPVVSQIVAYCGGWLALCDGAANFAEGIKKQVRGAHESISARWRESVAQQLSVPPKDRDAQYFAEYKSYQLPPGYVPGVEIDLPPRIAPKRDETIPMPAEFKRMVASIGKSMVKSSHGAAK